MSGTGALAGKPAGRWLGARRSVIDLATAASAVFEAFREQLEAGQLPRQQHASLRQLEAMLLPFPGHTGAAVVAGAGGSAGERSPGPSDHGAGRGQAIAAGPAADSSREARP